jgi:hypothetical protein
MKERKAFWLTPELMGGFGWAPALVLLPRPTMVGDYEAEWLSEMRLPFPCRFLLFRFVGFLRVELLENLGFA